MNESVFYIEAHRPRINSQRVKHKTDYRNFSYVKDWHIWQYKYVPALFDRQIVSWFFVFHWGIEDLQSGLHQRQMKSGLDKFDRLWNTG